MPYDPDNNHGNDVHDDGDYHLPNHADYSNDHDKDPSAHNREHEAEMRGIEIMFAQLDIPVDEDDEDYLEQHPWRRGPKWFKS